MSLLDALDVDGEDARALAGVSALDPDAAARVGQAPGQRDRRPGDRRLPDDSSAALRGPRRLRRALLRLPRGRRYGVPRDAGRAAPVSSCTTFPVLHAGRVSSEQVRGKRLFYLLRGLDPVRPQALAALAGRPARLDDPCRRASRPLADRGRSRTAGRDRRHSRGDGRLCTLLPRRRQARSAARFVIRPRPGRVSGSNWRFHRRARAWDRSSRTACQARR